MRNTKWHITDTPKLYGTLTDFEAGLLRFRGNLAASLDESDRVYNGINASIG